MKTTLLAAAALAVCLLGLSISSRDASARDYPYCAVAGGFNAYENCGYPTLRACMEAVSGVGGHCQPNPRYSTYDRSYEERRSFNPFR
jgi:hypothetical protein